MAVRNKTKFIANEIYFITFTILGWKHIFINKKYCDLVYKWFNYVEVNYNNKIYGYVIMPNHIHVLMYVSEKSSDLSKIVFNAKRFMAYEIVNKLKEESRLELLKFFSDNKIKKNLKHRLFESRYDSLIIQSRKFFLEKLNYIHRNPCLEKWNLSDKPEDYIYSSASNYISGKGVYDVDIIEY